VRGFHRHARHETPGDLRDVGTLLPLTTSAETKHSGVVVTVSPEARALALEELGEGGAVVRRGVLLGPDTQVIVARRAVEAAGWPGSYEGHAVAPGEIRPGDFVTVTLDPAGGDVARMAEIVRPAEEGAASPR
jgi:hypothetical protein